MNIPELISSLLSQDIHLWVEEDRLRINAPKGALTPDLREMLTTHKPEIMGYLKMAGAAHDTEPGRIYLAPRDQAIPLSFSQHRLWFLDQFDPGSTAYSILITVQLDGNLDTAILERSYNEIVRRHEALRTIFVVDESGQPIQKIVPYRWFTMPVVHLEDVAEEDREAEALFYLNEQARKPFDLSSGPLYRFEVVRLAESLQILFVNVHHTVFDGWSTGVLMNEMAILYSAFSAGQPSPLPELTIQYADYTVWQRKNQTPASFQKQLDFWKNKLGGSLPILELPADYPRPSMQTFNGSYRHVIYSKQFNELLKTTAARNEVTLYTVLMAAFKSLLYRLTGQTDLIIGTPVANRHNVEVEKLIGFFVNTLVLRTDVSGNPTFKELLHRLREESFEALAHQEMPFEYLVEALHLQRDTSHSPVFQVLFIFQNLPSRFMTIPRWKAKPVMIDPGSAKFDLTVVIGESDEGLHVTFEYNSDLFERETIVRFMNHYQTILESICKDTSQRLDDLPLLAEAERERIVTGWNNTRAPYPAVCLQDLFAAQAARTPDTVAVEFEEETITYAELDRRSNQLGRYLVEIGIGPEKLVGIHVDRSIDMVVGLLGVLKAGGAYLPLDPNFPRDRLGYMIEDSKAGVLLTQAHLLDDLPPNPARVICLDTDWADIGRVSTDPLDLRASPDSLAYVLYTSGSTGRPKGVQVIHKGLVNFLTSMRRRPGITPADRLLSVTTLSFDIAGLELYLPLISGARLVLVSSTTAADGGQLAEALLQTGATIMQATPATWRMLIAFGWQGSPELKVLCGGEALPADLAAALLERCGSLWNMYGPTETTIWSTLDQVTSADQPITIGRPIANTEIYLLDPHGRPVPVGVPGEMFIGGDGLARGYLNRPELTAEKFVTHLFGDQPDARLYRTGDMARWLPDGRIDFLGRGDHQVKIRGFRIELGEIEAVLLQHPAVSQSVVVAREDTPGDKRLVAYLVCQGDAPSTSELRAFTREKLPDYMIPAIFIHLEALPLTPNGKVDRRALPAPDSARPDLGVSYVPPQTGTEQKLAAIWQKVLQVDQVGVNDNFFELGGHSLLIVQVHHQLSQQFETKITIAQMFQYPTIQTLAQYLDRPALGKASAYDQKIRDRAALQKESLQRFSSQN